MNSSESFANLAENHQLLAETTEGISEEPTFEMENSNLVPDLTTNSETESDNDSTADPLLDPESYCWNYSCVD